ncbi:MAG: hypothetical protein JSU06_12700 [Actinobacteria bacterium]|nr:hypothetical protein [Actinomycetota bacterium]
MTNAALINAERTGRMAAQRVWATPEAVDAIVRLRNQLGSCVLRHVADESGAPEVRLVHDRIPRGPDDVALGTVGGVLFLIDREHDVALGCPDFQVDVTPPRIDNDATGVRTQYHLVSRAVHRR